MIWSAQLNTVPVAIRRSNLEGLAGAIVTLGSTGSVNIGYLGSDPNLFKVPPLNLQEINYEKAQKELAELEKEIQSGIDITDYSLAKTMAERDLQLKMHIDPNLVNCAFGTKLISTLDAENGPPKMCRVALSLKPATFIEQIQVCFNVRPPLKCSKSLHVISNVAPDTTERIEVWIYQEDMAPMATLKISAIVSFINKQSICRILEANCALPMELFYRKVQPQKDAAFKVTMNLDNVIASGNILSLLPAIFVGDNSQTVGLKSVSSDVMVTIVAAKNSNRIRVQSDSLAALSPVVEMLIDRINSVNKHRESSASSTMRRDHEYGHLAKIIESDPVKILIAPQIYTEEVLKCFEAHRKLQEDYNDQKVYVRNEGMN